MLREWEINPRQLIFSLVAAGVLFTLAAIFYFTGLNGDLTSRVKILENVLLESFLKNQELVLQSAGRIEEFARRLEADAQQIQADVKTLDGRAASIEERAAGITERAEQIRQILEERARIIEERAKAIEERSVSLQAVLEAGHKDIADRAEARHTTLEEHIKSTEAHIKSLQGLLRQQSPK